MGVVAVGNVVEMRPAYVELDFDEVESALTEAHGNITAAAMILRVPRSRLQVFIRNNPGVQFVLEQINESTLDFAEQVIFDSLKDPLLRYQAAKFVLQTKGKGRGWTTTPDKISVDQKGPGKLEISWGAGEDYYDPSRTIDGEVA